MPYKDPAIGRARAAARYRANRDQELAKRAAFHSAHPEKQKEWSSRSYQKRRQAELARRAEAIRKATPPPIIRRGVELRSVPLFGKGITIVGFALVDAGDFDAVNQFRWNLNSKGYVVRTERSPDGRKTTVILHRWLMGVPTGDSRQVDHIDGDRVDCSRLNLRILAGAENAQNRKSHGPSPYRGVHLRKGNKHKPWVANCHINGRQTILGLFATEAEAAECARLARAIHMPFSVERDDVQC